MNEFTPAPNVPEVPLCETLQSFARDFLGPISQELLAQPDVFGTIEKSVDMGVLPEDAALREIHARITEDGCYSCKKWGSRTGQVFGGASGSKSRTHFWAHP